MSRPIQINDLVNIGLPGHASITYTIRAIDAHGIYISTEENPTTYSLIISNGMGGFKIYETNQDYIMEFIISTVAPSPVPTPFSAIISTLTGSKDIDINILSQLDDKSLKNMCKIDKYVASLCEDIWKGRIRISYPEAIKYKNIAKAWSKYYDQLKKVKQFAQSLTVNYTRFGLTFIKSRPLDDFIDIFKWMQEKGIFNESGWTSVALQSDRVDLLDWLKNNNLLDLRDPGNDIGFHGSVKALDWLIQNKQTSEENIVKVMDRSSKDTYFDKTKWLYQNKKISKTDTNYLVNNAAGVGSIETLEWLEKNKGISPKVKGANKAAENGHIDVLEWLFHKGIYPDKIGVGGVLEEGKYDVLVWLDKKGLLNLPANAADRAVLGDNIHVLIWLEGKGIRFTSKHATSALQSSRYSSLNWLNNKGIDPSKDSINDIKKNKEEEDRSFSLRIGDTDDQIIWLRNHGYIR